MPQRKANNIPDSVWKMFLPQFVVLKVFEAAVMAGIW
jgi:hypothetical protein